MILIRHIIIIIIIVNNNNNYYYYYYYFNNILLSDLWMIVYKEVILRLAEFRKGYKLHIIMVLGHLFFYCILNSLLISL